MNRIEGEKALKRYLKRSVGFSLSILVGFLITGQVSLGADVNKELQIQDLLKSIHIEKEELNEKLLELDKELAIVKNSKDSSIQFFLSTLFENRKSKKADDNGFSDVIDDWEDSIKDKPNIDIPDIRDDVKPVVPDIPNPLPNEDSIVIEPDFGLEPVGNIAIGNVPNDIDITIDKIDLPVSEINDSNFNIPTDGNISKPEIEVIAIGDINLSKIDSTITTNIKEPSFNFSYDTDELELPTIIAPTGINAPKDISIDPVKMDGTGFNQGPNKNNIPDSDSDKQVVVENFNSYKTNNGFSLTFDQNDLIYSGDILLNGKNRIDDLRKYYQNWDDNVGDYYTPVAAFISDTTDDDTLISGKFDILYQVNKWPTEKYPFTRIFLSVNPAEIGNDNLGGSDLGDNWEGTPAQETVKVTNVEGEINLSTSELDSEHQMNGNLIAIEHQTWDKQFADSGRWSWDPLDPANPNPEFKNSYSVLINKSTINLGKTEENGTQENPYSENMIGIMVDLEESMGGDTKNQNNQTINAGTININGTNSIGFSFEEYRNEENKKDGKFLLRDDAYIGNINVNGTNNYGFRMGNIFSYINQNDNNDKKHAEEYATYFDKTRVYGNTSTGKIEVIDKDNKKDDDKTNNSETIEYLDKKIIVSGTSNAGMVIGKSLSKNASDYTGIYGENKVNPIANFFDVNIEVNGTNTIGFIRDKDYSDNNTNDMIIDGKNINVSFGESANGSVLYRSEQYGITLDKDITIGKTGATKENKNIVMQATAENWAKTLPDNTTQNIESKGSVTNKKTITNIFDNQVIGSDNLIGMLASSKDNTSGATITNNGAINFNANDSIGMAVLGNNIGKLEGGENNRASISIKNNVTEETSTNLGIYNEGNFNISKADINITGNGAISIYNTVSDGATTLEELNNKLATTTIKDTNLTIENGAIGIYSKGGNITSESGLSISDNTISTEKNNGIGVYGTNSANINLTGSNITINNGSIAVGADSGANVTLNNSNITYNGDKFALYTKDENSKITLTGESKINLGGKAYGMNIDTSRKDTNKAIALGGATINVNSNDVTIFNIVNTGEKANGITIDSSKYDPNAQSDENIKKYVGEYTISKESEKYGYNIASIDGGTINLDDSKKNSDIIKRYKFQRSDVNMTQDLSLSLSNDDITKFLSGQLVGIGMSSSSNIQKNYIEGTDGKTIGEQQREETKINISNSTLTVDNTTENDSSTSSLGVYINFGEVELVKGKIEVEDSDTKLQDNIGIYSKNGSKITTDSQSSITVHGNNGIGIYAEATKEFYEKEDGTKDENKNKFGGDITQLNINNGGDIILSGESGVGIYADGGTGTKGTVTNSGNITVGGGAEKNSSIGIYGINTEISNTGNITVGCNHNENKGSHTGVGIYAVNSTVTTGGTIALGDYATGIYLDENSNLDVTNKNEDLTFTSLENNTTDRIGIYATGEEGTTNKDINIDFNIDMGNVVGGKAIVADNRNVTLKEKNSILVSSNNSRGMRALDNATITNEGNIIVGDKILLNDINNTEEKQFASIGMTAANTNGTIHNSGTITVNSTNGIGIYIDNSDENVGENNEITSVGTINLNGEKNIGVVAKGTTLTLGTDKAKEEVSAQGINFGENSKNSIGIYADKGSTININEDISKTFTGKQTNNILMAGVESSIVNDASITITGNQGNNIGVYLGKDGQYSGTGTITAKNGATGIYADNDSEDLNDIKVISDSQGVQTIGVVLNSDSEATSKDKIISGNITLKNTNTSPESVNGKNLGIYANNSNVIIEEGKTLTLTNKKSNGTGLYLNNSTLSGNGTIEITGTGIDDSNSVGIYYTSNNQQEKASSDNSITVVVDKSNTIGVYVGGNSTLTKQSTGGVTIGSSTMVSNVTGLVASAGSTINNEGTISLNNTSKSTGIASLGGTVNNSGKITIEKNSKSGTGIFLSGESKLENTGTITIAEVAVNDKDNPANSHLGIGIYTKGEKVTIGDTGNFDIASGNVAIYSDGTNISSDINLADSNDLEKNSGTIALVAKSDRDSIEEEITKGTTIGGTTNDKMEITLAKGSTGIYALDSGVKISNVSIDATANEGYKENETNPSLSYGIYLGAGKEDNNTNSTSENYEINNTDISLVKGVGIVVNTTDTNKATSLTLKDSILNIDSYSEGDKAETGIGIYTQSGNITLAGGNTINTTYGVGIFGGEGSNINVGNETTKDTLNIKGYSVGIYSKGGEVNLGDNTDIIFQKGAAQGESTEVSKGVGAYIIDGNITSSADIKIDGKNTIISDGIVGILGKQSTPNTQKGTVDKEVSITNSGNIELSGNSVVGIAGIGNETSTEKVSITNSGSIVISGNKEKLSTGIYGQDANIINGGSITVGDYATGIYYTGNKNNNIHSESINLVGEDSIGVILKGNTESTNLAGIYGDISKERNLGIYLDNYSSESTNIGNIELGNQSMGLYINNSSTTIDNVGNISVGDNGFGIASVGNEDGTDTVTIANNGTIKVGNFGTAVYVKDSTLNMNSLAGVEAGKNGTVLHVNNGTLNIDTTINELTFDGNIGMILENGGDITSKNGKIDTIKVINGGTGILVKGNDTKRPDILADNTTINLGSGNENSYSVGIYYQDADVISNNNKDDKRLDIDIVRENGSHHTIGTIYDRTYGTIDNFNIVMDNSISNSIGTIIRRDSKDEVYDGNTDENKVVLNSGTNSLIDVNGQHNIGIIGKNSIIEANGDIKVGLDETSSGSIGVYLTGTDSEWKHSYTGKGDINVGSHSYGIYAKNYDATHNGNITTSGKESVGIASVILDDEAHGHTHTITVNDSILTVKDGAIGIFGRDTNIDVNNGTLNVSGNNSTGIASLQDGDINFTGSANISGKGSSGIYKNTILDNTLSQNKSEDTDTITVGNGNWIIGDTASGIVAISRNKDANGNITDIGNSIKIDNSSNMTLGNGAIGIYSAGANIVNNNGDITVGAASIDGKDILASIGIYMANGVGNTMAIGTNNGNITVENNGGVGIQVAGYVDFTNNGDIKVSDGAEGLHSSYGAKITNTGEITVTGKGTGMIASGKGSEAINNGTINLEKDDIIVVEDGENSQYNTSLIGMAAVDGGHIINGKEGIINVNDGIGMYVDEISSFVNSGTINVNNGVGIMDVGKLENIGGTINVSSNGTATVELDESLSDKGSLVVNREENILEVNDNFSNIGGILETDYNIKLNNPTVDITAGGAGFIAPNISGDIKLDSNFALEGDGLSFSVEDFIDPEADININTSPLFKTDITEGDLTVNKVDYKDITLGNQFDNRDNSLDNILANGGVDADILKNLNYYLDSLGNTTIFDSEADRLLGAIGGNIYSNIQSRMQDISRTFDNSFEEMVTAPNPTYENTKYSLIYTNGDYENTNEQVVDYDYDIKGINYMKEYDLSEQGKRYGYTFGFTGAKFEFDDFSKSEEDIYSLRGGAHRISYLDNSLTWFSRAEVGYNHHRVDRKVVIPGASENIENRAWYGSYQVSLDNKLRKEIFANENSNFGTYTALNLEYGLFDDIKESGNLELKVKSNDYFSSKAVIGLDGKFSKPINDNWSIRLNGDINYSYDFGDNYGENDARFRSQDSYYSLASEVESRDVLSGKLSVGLDKSDYMSIALHAQAFRDFRRDEDYWNAGLTFTYRFNNHAVPEKFLDMHNYFKFDNSELNSDDKKNIKEMAEYINKNNMQGTLLIEGHTDDTGKASYNDKLSLKRANAVKEEFEKTLTNKDNIQVKVIGHGEEKPEYKNINESARSKNRRAQINMLNK